ncbi:MAG: transcriptional regulator [Planctomycetes bacterium]|nr:transcriptional regulator [Planctomycetota bacterium]
MTSVPQTAATGQEDLHQDMVDLGNLITTLPGEYRTRLEPVFARVMESTRRRRRILTLVQEALSQLRLDMKYLVFDLEATRRERDAFRQLLDGNSTQDESGE